MKIVLLIAALLVPRPCDAQQVIFSDWSVDVCPGGVVTSVAVQWDPTVTPQQLSMPTGGTVPWTLVGYMLRLTIANQTSQHVVKAKDETAAILVVSPASTACVAVRSYGMSPETAPPTTLSPMLLRIVPDVGR